MSAKRHVDREFLRVRIEVDLATQKEVGKELGVSSRRVSQWCRQFEIKTQRTGPRSGEGHPNWSGGRVIDRDGYVMVYRPDHPRARKRGHSMKPIYVPEHILVAEQKLGRSLLEKEVVHHRNGIRHDNRPENLEVFATNADHLRHELTGRVPQWTPEGRARILAGCRKPRGSRKA